MGWIYLVAAVVAGAVFLARGAPAARPGQGRSRRGPSLRPMRLFHFSITYLTLLFVAVAIDPLLHLPL